MHSKAITAQFQTNGIAGEHVDGETPHDERQAILERFRTGTTKIISNCAILMEGFDCPDSEAVVIARPTTSVTLWLQMLGRVLRPSPGKDKAIMLDMTDNWSRLGRPCDDRKWSLDPVSCDPDTFGTRCCPHCHHAFKPMPALIRAQEYFNSETAEFVTVYEADCPNCGMSFQWILGESQFMENDKVPVIISTEDIQFKEIPPFVRPTLLRPILQAKKRKFRSEEKKLLFYHNTIKNWFIDVQELNLIELNYAVELLGCHEWAFEYSIECLTARIRKAQKWEQVINLVSLRPENVKKVIWTQLSRQEKEQLQRMKVQYEREIKQLEEWTTEENLIIIADDLEACSDIEMISSIWLIYNQQAIKLAVERLSTDKREQVNQWIAQLDTNKNRLVS